MFDSASDIVLAAVLSVVVIGLVAALLWGLRLRKNFATFTTRARRTRGAVTSALRRETGGDHSRTWFDETIEFSVGTRSVSGSPEDNGWVHRNRRGEVVHVFYDPDDPEIFYAPKNGEKLASGDATFFIWFPVVTLGCLALAAVIVLVF